jgi:hypothetical protein
MKWIVKRFRFYCVGKGDPAGDSTVIGYSDKSEQELFEVLEKEYPNVPIRKEVISRNKSGWEHFDAFDKDGKKDNNFLYEDCIYFTANTLKEF